jgi:hypothetical protein
MRALIATPAGSSAPLACQKNFASIQRLNVKPRRHESAQSSDAPASDSSVLMDKKALTETDIRTKFITPAILGPNGSKWNVMTHLLEERYFTKGRIIVRGKTVARGEAKKADYILFYKPNIPIAVVEANDNNHSVGAGICRDPRCALRLQLQ